MSNILFANNASTVLAAPISSSATSCTVTTGTGAEFPNPTGGQYFVMTFVDAATGLTNEIVHVTARSGDTMTILRAQEGTAAVSWLAGDLASNYWTAGSILALLAGFPVGTGVYSSNTTLSSSDAGNMIRISGSNVVITLPSASANSGMTVGVSAASAFTLGITSGGGQFAGPTPISGLTSVAMAVNEFLCVQSNGTNWIVFSGSPKTLAGGIIALQSWVTANFDALGAAAAAQANAEAFAQALAGNLGGEQSVITNTVFTSANYGQILRLTGGASANSTFTCPTPLANGTESSVLYFENSSNFNLLCHVAGSAINFYGLTSASGWVVPTAGSPSMTLPPQSSAIAIGTPSGWLVIYNTTAFAPAVFPVLPMYSKTVSLSTTTANNTTYTLTSQVVAFPSWGISQGFRIKARASLAGSSTAAMQQNFQLQLTDGVSSESGANWMVYTDAIVGVGIESSFFINNVYAEGATPTFTLKVTTLGGGSHAGQMAMTSCTLDIQVENA